MKENSFIRHVVALAGGAGMAQVLMVLASPVLTRLYQPEDFGLFAVLMAIVASLLMGASGKYETAMALPKSNKQGQELLGIAIYFAMIFCALLMTIFVIAKQQIIDFLGVAAMDNWILLAPVLLFIVSLSEILAYYANRDKAFGQIGRSRLIRALSIISVNIILGIMGADFKGLLIGNIIGYSLASVYLIYVQHNKLTISIFSLSAQKGILFRRYIDYPLLNASSGILNGIQFNMPVLFLAHYFPEVVVGYYALVMRVAYTPLLFLSVAISHVNLRKVVELVQEGKPVTPYLHRVTLGLAAIVVIPTIIFILKGPELFAWLFGQNWTAAGEYLQILAISISARFVAFTLSLTLDATRNNKYAAIWKTTAFIMTLAVFIWFAPRGNITELLIASAVNDVLLYIFYYVLILRAAKNPKNFDFNRRAEARIASSKP
jgi:lipopolysaccharide exporter